MDEKIKKEILAFKALKKGDYLEAENLLRKIVFLKQVHQMNLYGDGLPSICPSYFSSELDLPNGSYWSLVVADLLDFLEQTSKHKSQLED